jgi:excisionase family DNA binding protein
VSRRRTDAPRHVTPAVMTVPELAAYLRIHPATVYRLLRRRALPGFKMGDWRFNVEQIEQWRIDQQAAAQGR